MTSDTNDCFAPSAALMRHGEALSLLKARLSPQVGTEAVPLYEAAGRMCAAEINSPFAVPRHTNAAVDGYAFAARDYDFDNGSTLPVTGRSAAGHPVLEAMPNGAAVRILTGGVMPDGFDTVAMQEDSELSERADGTAMVGLPAGLKTGANVRKAGEDLAQGEKLFGAGDLLRPQDLAALASIGIGNVICFRRLRVAVVSSGDEIVKAGSRDLGLGEVYDANGPMLSALLRLTGAEVFDLGVWADDRKSVTQQLEAAAKSFDVILTSGGASQGEEDHMSAALGALGSRHFWRIAVKPGRPMMFGQIGDATMIGLPGNPVAVFVCFLVYVYPMLRRLSGARWPEPRRFQLPAAFAFDNRKVGRREYWRGKLLGNGLDEPMRVEKFARDGSGLISGLREADGLIEVAEEIPAVAEGDLVSFIPFSEFGILGQ